MLNTPLTMETNSIERNTNNPEMRSNTFSTNDPSSQEYDNNNLEDLEGNIVENDNTSPSEILFF